MSYQSDVLLYVHIPKSGGSTLAHCLYNQAASESELDDSGQPACSHAETNTGRFFWNGIYHYPIGFFKHPADSQPNYVLRNLRRRDLRGVIGHFSFGIHTQIKKPTTYITMLRNPVDRIISLYQHLVTMHVLSEDLPISEFVEECPSEAWRARLQDWYPQPPVPPEQRIRRATQCLVDNDQTRRLAGVEPNFGDCSEKDLALAIDNLRSRFAVVGVTRHFDLSLILLKHALQWDTLPCYYPRLVNPAARNPPWLSPQVRALIESRNELDLRLYQFAVQLVRERVACAGPQLTDELAQFREQNAQFMKAHNKEMKQWQLGD